MMCAKEVKTPVALIPVGMMFLVTGIMFPYFAHATTQAMADLLDGLRGMLYGVAIGVNFLAVWLMAW